MESWPNNTPLLRTVDKRYLSYDNKKRWIEFLFRKVLVIIILSEIENYAASYIYLQIHFY